MLDKGKPAICWRIFTEVGYGIMPARGEAGNGGRGGAAPTGLAVFFATVPSPDPSTPLRASGLG